MNGLFYALVIPCILSILAYIIWKKEIIWWEMLIPIVVSLVAILISYYSLKYVSLKDVEYNGYRIVQARYYEYWETWVEQTCSYCCSTDKDGNCTATCYYDCSYCDHNAAYWQAIDEGGHTFGISKQKYDELLRKWSATPKFNELNRNINRHGSCGKDGNMYSINWDGKIETSECSVLEVGFQNLVKCNHSAFQYPIISPADAAKLQLYRYPASYDYYKQNAILGLDSFKLDKSIQVRFEYLNGWLGPINKVKIFTLLFKNKPIDIAFKQEAFWDGGNQNEMVVCIGLNDTLGIEWVKPFSWCDNKRVLVDNREDIAQLKKFDDKKIYDIYVKNIHNFHYKDFKDFNYLSFEPTTGQIWFVYILTLIVSVLTLWWCIKNEIYNTDIDENFYG